MIIGGGKRGVVSTACYIARIKGVRSAMPMFKALEACPEAIVIPPDMEKYVRVGREVRAMMQALTPLVEPISIDEAFLDLAGTERLHRKPPALVLAEFARDVEQQIGITMVGLSYCKFLAKIASDMMKPRGFSVIGEAEALGLPRRAAGELDLGRRQGVRRNIGGRRHPHDRPVAADGAHRSDAPLRRHGQPALPLSRGQDVREVDPDQDAKSISAETTFDIDLASPADLVPVLRAMSEKVSSRLKKSGLTGRTVVLKLRTQDFRIRTRNRQLGDPTRLAERIFQTGLHLLGGRRMDTLPPPRHRRQ